MSLDPVENASLLEYRKDILQLRQEQSASLDKHILALATAAIGVSIVFLEKIAGQNPQFMCIVISSLIALIICVFSSLFSFFSSRMACDQTLRQLDVDIANGKYPDFQKYEKSWSTAVTSSNIISSVSFVIGLILLCIFAIKNI